MIADAAGKTFGEVYDAVMRLEVKPGGANEEWFVPIRISVKDAMSTKASADAGMRPTIEIP